MPSRIIDRANDVLTELEKSHDHIEINKKGTSSANDYQLSFIQLNDPLLEQIRDDILNTDINNLTPVEALMKLNTIKKILDGK